MTVNVGDRPQLATRCVRCGTELAPTMLACPACDTLVHAERLKSIAGAADAARGAGNLLEETQAWQEALDLLPPSSKQYQTITDRVNELARQLASSPNAPAPATEPSAPWYKRGSTAAAAILILALTKGKFLLLGLTKAKTFLSMFAFFGVYWTMYGWAFALGLVLTIYIHEMGHVYVLRKLGIQSGAPLFIPGLGAMILMKQRITDPSIDAKVGLAGPIWGLGAGLAAYAVYLATDAGIWGAIAAVTGFINLFNLIPIWQLDGSRGFHALSSWQRWVAIAALAAAFYLTGQKMLLIVGAVALFRGFQYTETPGDNNALATYVALVFALSWLSGAYSIG
jgi:Zn-dependent protease